MTDPHAFYGSRDDDRELDRRVTELMVSVARFGAGTGLDLVVLEVILLAGLAKRLGRPAQRPMESGRSGWSNG
ncbi:hypothetical protein [Nocardia sp. NBC_01329]|uniref:hypothetical protein n=1 Tax=Nocardia sp. NBC_01329 TaxID=2903594 RepID=UPI002E137F41|nr:hypothetical protein OG405_09065 [Nocardia sp. NBC_01329]